MESTTITFNGQQLTISSFVSNGRRWYLFAPLAQALGYTRTNDASASVSSSNISSVKDHACVSASGFQSTQKLVTIDGIFEALRHTRSSRTSIFYEFLRSTLCPTFAEPSPPLPLFIYQRQFTFNESAALDVVYIHSSGEEEQRWLLASPLASMLEYTSCFHAVQRHVEPENYSSYEQIAGDRFVLPATSSVALESLRPNSLFLTVAGLFQLIRGSRLPRAAEFRRWIDNDVLPTLFERQEYNLQRDVPSPMAEAVSGFRSLAGLDVSRPELSPASSVPTIDSAPDSAIDHPSCSSSVISTVCNVQNNEQNLRLQLSNVQLTSKLAIAEKENQLTVARLERERAIEKLATVEATLASREAANSTLLDTWSKQLDQFGELQRQLLRRQGEMEQQGVIRNLELENLRLRDRNSQLETQMKALEEKVALYAMAAIISEHRARQATEASKEANRKLQSLRGQVAQQTRPKFRQHLAVFRVEPPGRNVYLRIARGQRAYINRLRSRMRRLRRGHSSRTQIPERHRWLQDAELVFDCETPTALESWIVFREVRRDICRLFRIGRRGLELHVAADAMDTSDDEEEQIIVTGDNVVDVVLPHLRQIVSGLDEVAVPVETEDRNPEPLELVRNLQDMSRRSNVGVIYPDGERLLVATPEAAQRLLDTEARNIVSVLPSTVAEMIEALLRRDRPSDTESQDKAEKLD